MGFRCYFLDAGSTVSDAMPSLQYLRSVPIKHTEISIITIQVNNTRIPIPIHDYPNVYDYTNIQCLVIHSHEYKIYNDFIIFT